MSLAVQLRDYGSMCAFWGEINHSDIFAVDNFISNALIQTILDQVCALDEAEGQSSALVPYSAIGYVYAAWNPLFGGLIKIGATKRSNPGQRVAELSSAGVPEPFQLVASIPCADPFELEAEIHRHYHAVRKYGRKKEFFALSRDEVMDYFHILCVSGWARISKGRRRKHKRVYTGHDLIRFKAQIAEFIESCLVITDDALAFVSTLRMKQVFDQYNPKDKISNALFSKELRKQMVGAGFPDHVVAVQRKRSMGYTGIMISEPRRDAVLQAGKSIDFQQERVAWKERNEATIPAPRRLYTLGPDSLFFRLLADKQQGCDGRFRNISAIDEGQQPDSNTASPIQDLTIKVATDDSPNGQYRAMGFRYSGPRVTKRRLWNCKFIREAFGVEKDGHQYLIAILEHKYPISPEKAIELIGQLATDNPEMAAVYAFNQPTNDAVLATVKTPNKQRWVWKRTQSFNH